MIGSTADEHRDRSASLGIWLGDGVEIAAHPNGDVLTIEGSGLRISLFVASDLTLDSLRLACERAKRTRAKRQREGGDE